MKTILLGVVFSSLAAVSALAAHNNPWAGSDDTVLAKEHDANQEKSLDTPGEDQMRGALNQNVSPKAGGGRSNAASGSGAGQPGGGNGGPGKGRDG